MPKETEAVVSCFAFSEKTQAFGKFLPLWKIKPRHFINFLDKLFILLYNYKVRKFMRL